MKKIMFDPIGYVESSLGGKNRAPFQGVDGEEVGVIHLDEKYRQGLKDLDTFSHILVVFCFDRAKGFALRTKTPWGEEERGVFATRSTHRPNPIGISACKLVKIDGNRLEIEGIDMFDGTPVLDIKPYTPRLYPRDANEGWRGNY